MPAEIFQKSGFEEFVDGVRAYLTAHAVAAEFAAGWLQRPKQGTRPGGSRIVIGPSDAGGRGGQILPARGPGIRYTATQAWRPLASWEMQLACYVWATDRSSEEAQVSATFRLMQWAMRAIADASNGNFTFGATDWTTPETLTQLGRELKLSFTIRTHVIDVPWDLTGPLKPNMRRGPPPV
jgi:hypothetical protein